MKRWFLLLTALLTSFAHADTWPTNSAQTQVISGGYYTPYDGLFSGCNVIPAPIAAPCYAPTLTRRIQALFANGEQGAWYDPSDFSTLFQDAAGTTPVTAVGQPVGLMRDKSGRGNHASQTTTANRPVLSARVNQLTSTEDISNSSVWSVQGTATTPNATTLNTPSTNDYIFQFDPTLSGKQITLSAKLSGSGTASLVTYDNVTPGGFQYHQITLTAVPTRYSFVATFGAGAVDCRVGVGRFGTNTATTITATEFQVDVGAITRYQRVNTSSDYDTVGFPIYLAFNGTNSSMATAAINFTATDKMTVVAGVRKLSDAAQGVVSELSASIAANNGTFLLAAPNSAAANYAFSAKGTTQQDNVVTTYTAPITNVITGQADIAGATNIVRVNGATKATVAATLGTGNFGNYPLYIGARAGTGVFFNGNLYSLIVRGAASSASQIQALEAYTNSKTGAY